MPRKPRQKLQDHQSDSDTISTATTPEDPSIDPPEQYVVLHTGNRIAPERKATIYSCVDHAKMSPTEIARRLKMDVRTVNAVLANRDADAVEARNYLAANVLQAAEDWVTASKEGARKGKHTAAKDLLLHTKVIEPIQDNQTNVQVAIVVGAPGQPLALNPPQVIESKDDSDTPVR